MEKLQHGIIDHIQPKEVVEYEPTNSQIRELGSAALGGFKMMPEALSINEDIRDYMESRVIGQPAAIDAIVESMDRREARLQSDRRPIANFMFLGPTGVGKTETARALAEAIGSDEEANLVKINCSEYSTGHHVNRLLGAPQAYKGYGDQTVLNIDNVKENAVILFDEIEKGCPELYDTLLQIMDDGELSLGNGDVVDFRDTVIVMTSNLGAERITEHLKNDRLGFMFAQSDTDMSKIEDAATSSLNKKFKPEFIGRITNKIVFHPLDKESLSSILDVKLNDVNEEYETYEDCFRVSLSDKTREVIIEEAHQNNHEGARPLIKTYESKIQSMIGRYYSGGMIEKGSHVKILHRDEVGQDGQNQGMPDLVFTSAYDPALVERHEYNKGDREQRRLRQHLSAKELEVVKQPWEL